MKRNVTISIAIIPNNWDSMMLGWTGSLAPSRRRSIDGLNQRFGLDAKYDEKAVEIWYGSEKEGWQDGNLPKELIDAFPAEINTENSNRFYRFDRHGNRLDILPKVLPARLFIGKKEGDVVKLFESETCIVYGELRQLQNRYRRFGNFEDVFAAVTR